jgi:Phospholipase_D-nuclease N-terminal
MIPMLEIYWVWSVFILLFVFIPLIFAWAFVLVDMFMRRDLSGWAKAGWLLLVLVLPLLGALIYLVARPRYAEGAPSVE